MIMSLEISIIQSVVEQHVDDSAFLWLLRDNAVRQPHFSLDELKELDDRILANIDGIIANGNPAWEICENAMLREEPGEIFTASIIAFKSGIADRVDKVIHVAIQNTGNLRGLISALGFLPFSRVEPWLQRMINANAMEYHSIAVSAYAIHRVDPGSALLAAVNDSNVTNKARALRVVGELKRKDFLQELHHNFEAEYEACRFWSAWSALLLGDYSAMEIMKEFWLNRNWCGQFS